MEGKLTYTLEELQNMMERSSGWLDLGGTQITGNRQYRRLEDGDYEEGRYLYADGILTHIKSKRAVRGYTFYVGKIKGKNVISDGTHYAHCATLREGVVDLLFKNAADRGADQYKGLKLDDTVSRDEAMAIYRIITGACKQGTQNFVDNLKETKDEYSIREMIELTKGQYGSDRFQEFFNEA